MEHRRMDLAVIAHGHKGAPDSRHLRTIARNPVITMLVGSLHNAYEDSLFSSHPNRSLFASGQPTY